MKSVNRICAAGMLLLALGMTGCGRQEVEYEEENIKTEADTGGKAEFADTVENLQIQDTNNRWKETIETEGEPVDVSAELEIDLQGVLSTLEVTEHYFSADEKQQLLEYFFDPESIRIDRDTYPTKELLQEKLELYKNTFKEAQDNQLVSTGEEETKMISNEEKRLTNLISGAPAYEEVPEQAAGYDENHYKGTRDGAEYSLSFDINQDENRSGWTLQAKDYSSFLVSGEAVTGCRKEYVTEYENLCKMTKEEAVNYAEKILNELGLPNLKQNSDPKYLIWNLENGEKECNGYYLQYGLDINGNVMPDSFFAEGVKRGGCFDADRDVRSYDETCVTFMINDKGLIHMEYNGIISAGECSSIKLLSYERIKDCFREILKKENSGDKDWEQLILTYARLSYPDKPDTYVYVPVWILNNGTSEITNNIMINAIDGTRIDMDTQVYVVYETPESWLETYQTAVLEQEDISTQ